MNEKLNKLFARCKYGIHITVNAHRDLYNSVEDELNELTELTGDLEIAPEVRQKMIDTDTIIEIHFYPDAPVSFYHVHHYDFELALDEALKCLES